MSVEDRVKEALRRFKERQPTLMHPNLLLLSYKDFCDIQGEMLEQLVAVPRGDGDDAMYKGMKIIVTMTPMEPMVAMAEGWRA